MCGEYNNGTMPCSSFVGVSSSESLIVVFVIISLGEGVVCGVVRRRKNGNVHYLNSTVGLFGRGVGCGV